MRLQRSGIVAAALAFIPFATGQETPKSAPAKPAAAPTSQTQKSARTFNFNVPAPRGQIVAADGTTLANNRVGYNLAIQFPPPDSLADKSAIQSWINDASHDLSQKMGRAFPLSVENGIKHYRNRAIMPWIVSIDLSEKERTKLESLGDERFSAQPFYVRTYPHGQLAGHVLGYIGIAGRFPDTPVENNDYLFPEIEGRYALELAYENQLAGKPGQLNLLFNNEGRVAQRTTVYPPTPGMNVVTTLNLDLQRVCEEVMAKSFRRGAAVFINPNTGDILAMASWPPLNPSLFVTGISQSDYAKLDRNPDEPLRARAYKGTYPPGSTFKCFVGAAALASGKLDPAERIPCPAALEIGNRAFKNHKRSDRGDITFVEALTESCNTWFYAVGMRLGGPLIMDYACQFGFGSKTGIPLGDEASGIAPTEEYLREKRRTRYNPGLDAQVAIGQGDTEVTPLQMAHAMGALGNGGNIYASRLISQIQDITGEVIHSFPPRVTHQVELPPATLLVVREAMISVVTSRNGTGSRAAVPGITIAGKTGTAQWFAKGVESTVGWFGGFAPAEGPNIAFAVAYEGEPHDNSVHGGTHAAPLVGAVLKKWFEDKSRRPATITPAIEALAEFAKTMPPPIPPDAAQSQPDPATAAPQQSQPPPKSEEKPSFWKRLFGK
jgi:penicillin-binding protein 2